MKVILLEEIPSLGKVGDVVKVANGYGRNYLIPQKKALEATTKNVKVWERQKSLFESKLDKAKRDAEKLAIQIESLSCTVSKQAGEEDRLFGSVTTMDIEESLKRDDIEIDRKKILLEEPIKKLGIYTVPVKLHPEVMANLKVWVVKS
ncbi:MAG: 50S ribosomal protein L9 [Thermodesulfobacteriota bacterium]|nr:50S ribosomal protein L9 [Thermodesulfobacteriota bacterium]